ncbi:hypothetical protein [Salegentibacter sp.]|uniref:hypothetical protein n=1 Tax=Salegentibacter sp. TaxID=1903072 RepID=UPI0035647F26
MKKMLTGIFVFLLLACQPKTPKQDLISWLPQESEMVIQSPDLARLKEKLSSLEFLNENDFKLKTDLQENFSFLQHIDSLGNSLIAFSDLAEDKYTFILISENQPKLKLDSVKNKSVERIKFDDFEFDKVSIEENVFFITREKGIFLASNSRKNLKALLEKKENFSDAEFQKAYKATDPKKNSVLINHKLSGEKFTNWFPEADSTFTNFGSWSSIDLAETEGSIRFNGLSLWPKKPGVQQIFQNTGASPNQISQVVPASAPGYSSFGYQDFEQFEQNLNRYFQKDFSSIEKKLLENTSEIGVIHFSEEEVVVLNNLDVVLAEQNLKRFRIAWEDFRNVTISEFDDPELFKENLKPLMNAKDFRFFTVLENFVLFSNKKEHLQDVITAFANKNTLAQQEYFMNAFEYMAAASNILLVANNEGFKEIIKEKATEGFGNEIAELDFGNNRLTALQVVADRDFSHIHGIFHKSEAPAARRNTEQLLSVKLDAEILGKPVFFSNHTNNQKDIAVQDINNVLYLISNKGTIFWKKQLDGPILGEIKEVDILKNGKFQLAFATPNRLEVIARNGKPVKPFPLKFKDEITQPLALFDYDNNRNYRFLVTQGRELFMYDSKGRSVKGFGFDQTSSEVLFPPKHIRMRNRDYILIAEESGKLNILSRQGKHRVKPNENFNFSENPWYEFEGQFISGSSLGEIVSVDEKGKVSRQNLNFADNYKLDATSNLLVSFSENMLKIRDKEIAMDFGVYTEPKIFLVNNKYYITITDLQTQKVYVLDSNAELLPGFPVYGTSAIDIANIDIDNSPEFVVKGDNGEILIYRF